MASTTIFRLMFNRSYTTFVKTSHGYVTVSFDPIVISERTENSQYSTADKEVIAALKKHEHFGSLFYIEEAGKTEEAAPKPEPLARNKPVVPSALPPVQEPGSNDIQNGGGGADGQDADPSEKDDEGNSGSGADSETTKSPEKADGSADVETGYEGKDVESGNKDDGSVHDTTVTSKNKAIAYLLEKYGAKFSQTADIAAMKQEALTVYKLVFDNWK